MKKSSLLVLGVFALSLGAAVRAEDGWEKGIRLFAEGKWSGAQQFFESFVESHPTHSLAAFYLGRAFFQQEHYNQAIRWFSRAVELDSDHSDYHLWLGRAYGYQAQRASVFKQPFLARQVKKHLEKAGKAYLAALDLVPDNLDVYHQLASLYERTGQHGKASRVLAKILEVAAEQE